MEMQTARSHEREGSSLARGLGWFSLGLGLAEVAAPRAVSKLIGVCPTSKTRLTLRAFGAREIAAGVAILQWPERSKRVWSRVAGDALDLGALLWALRAKRTNKDRLFGAIAAVVGVTAVDVLTARRVARAHAHHMTPSLSITINRSPADVYAFWSSLEDWNMSNVTFMQAPDGFGTVVRVELPQGKIGKLLGKSPTMKDLRELKQIIETGEVVMSDATTSRLPHAAQPPKGEMR